MEDEDEDVVVRGIDESVGWGRAIEEDEDAELEVDELDVAGCEDGTRVDARFCLREAMMFSSMVTSISAAS